MASWREMERLRKSPDEFRSTAFALLTHAGDAVNPWEAKFLNDITMQFRRATEFSLRQTETLLEIKNKVTPIETLRDGFSVAILLKRCHEARNDLSESDEEWLARLLTRSRTTIRGSEAGRLLRCARQLGLIDTEDE